MAFGRKKDKKDKNNKPNTQSGTPAEVQAKPSESLGTVLSESVPAASLDIIRANEPFNYKEGATADTQCYVVATLDVNDIGGLNKHMKSDPDKGQFIEQINNCNIECHVSEKGIEEGKFVIIPTGKTIQSLSEFSFLADSDRFAKFIPTFVKVDANGNMTFEELDARVDFKWFGLISKSRVTISEAIAALKSGVAPTEHDPVPVEETEAPAEAPAEEEVSTMASELGMEIPQDDDTSEEFPYEEAEPDSVETYQEEVPPQDDVQSYIEANTSNVDVVECPNCHSMMYVGQRCPVCGYVHNGESIAQEILETQDVVQEITDAEVAKAAEYLFHAGDIDLAVSSAPFDVQYMSEETFVPISEDRGDGWLDGYVTQMVKNANAELNQLHKKNLFIERERYLALLSKACDEISNQVNLDDSSNKYYKAKKLFMEQAAEKRNAMEVEVDKRRGAMQAVWDDELRQIQDSAAAAAKRTYLDKHSKSHEAQLRNVETELADEIDVEYKMNLTQLNEERKNDAKRRLDIAIAQTLITIGNDYKELLADEEERRQRYLDQIQEYIDTHRKDEVARINVLDQELKQKDEATKVTEEFTRKIQSITSEHDSTCDKLRQEIEAARKHEETVNSECKIKVDEANAKTAEIEKKYTELTDKYVNIDNQKKAEYEGRINKLENDVKASDEHLAHVDTIHNKYNKVATIVWVAVAVAMFCIGLLIGRMFLMPSAAPAGGNYSISFTTPEGAETETEETTETDGLNFEEVGTEENNAAAETSN